MLHSLPEYPQRPGSSPHEGLRAAGLFPSFSRPHRYLYPAGFPFRLSHEATGISSVPPLHQSFACCIRCRNIRNAPAFLRMEGSAPPGSFPHFSVPADTFIRQAFRSGFPMKRQGLPPCRLSTSIYMLHSLPEYPQRPGSSPHEGFRAAGLFPSFSRPRRYLYPAGFPFLLPHEATGISFVPPLHQYLHAAFFAGISATPRLLSAWRVPRRRAFSLIFPSPSIPSSGRLSVPASP